jgi:hypothetical protein
VLESGAAVGRACEVGARVTESPGFGTTRPECFPGATLHPILRGTVVSCFVGHGGVRDHHQGRLDALLADMDAEGREDSAHRLHCFRIRTPSAIAWRACTHVRRRLTGDRTRRRRSPT